MGFYPFPLPQVYLSNENITMTDRVPICPINIEHVVMLSDKYDAYTCIQCDIWLEKRCKDPECEFCKDRPERPRHDSLGGYYV
jgi:hypothetical protein